MLFLSSVYHVFASVHCCLVDICRETADLLALVCDVYCDCVTFPFGILGQVWYSIVSIPDPCCLSNLVLDPCPPLDPRNYHDFFNYGDSLFGCLVSSFNMYPL